MRGRGTGSSMIVSVMSGSTPAHYRGRGTLRGGARFFRQIGPTSPHFSGSVCGFVSGVSSWCGVQLVQEVRICFGSYFFLKGIGNMS